MKKILSRCAVMIIVAMNLLDLITTEYVLTHGGHEGNGLSAWLISIGLLVPAKLGIVTFIVATSWWNEHKEKAMSNRIVGVRIGVAVIYLLVVAWNTSRVIVYYT